MAYDNNISQILDDIIEHMTDGDITQEEKDDLLDKIADLEPADGVGRFTKVISDNDVEANGTGKFKEVVIDNHDSPVGTILTVKHDAGDPASMTANTWYEWVKMDIPAGTWVIISHARFVSTVTTANTFQINLSTTSKSDWVQTAVVARNTADALTTAQTLDFVTYDKTTSTYLNICSKYAAAKVERSDNCFIKAIRIA